MRKYQERQKIRKIIYSNFFLAALFILLIILLFSAARIFSKSRAAYLKNRELKNELEELRARKTELEQELAKLRTEEGMEEEIRKKFNVGKPEEEILVIVDKNAKDDKMNSEETGDGFFTKIFGWLKNIF